MQSDASLGVVDEVLTHINDAMTTLQNGQLKDKFTDEDEKWLEIIHSGRNPLVDLACDALQAGLKAKGGQIAMISNQGQQDGMMLTRAAFAVMVKFS